ncbi:hypothetical protein BVRB_9g205640 [Beta vulgaris subsp. vulgaris]|nr:hypothetical protein BVRB_9g205640 [Beta vulgaris subsp. vulgaris]
MWGRRGSGELGTLARQQRREESKRERGFSQVGEGVSVLGFSFC